MMRPVYIKIGKERTISQLIKNGVEIDNVFKGDRYYQTSKLIYIYDEDEHKLYSTKIQNNGKYGTLTEVNDESKISVKLAKVFVDNTNRGDWILSTQSRHSDMSTTTYYMSNSNYHVNNGQAWVKIVWSGLTSFTLKYGSYGESNYDYVKVWQMDRVITDFSTNSSSGLSISSDPTSSYPLLSTYGKYNSSAPNLEYTFTCDTGTHHVWICYRKDGSGHSYEDRGYIGIATELLKNIVNINVDYYTVVKDSYIFYNNKYYEKLKYSVDNSERKGNLLDEELSSDREIINIGDKQFYCNYYYVTLPNGTKLRTDKYVVGDEILIKPIPQTTSYIRTSGAGGVNTGVYPTTNTWMEFEVSNLKSKSGDVNIGISVNAEQGTWTNPSDSTDWRFFITTDSTPTLYWDRGSARNSKVYGYTSNRLKITCKWNNFSIYDVTKSISVFSGTSSSGSIIQGYPIWIEPMIDPKYSGDYHYIKIYEGDQLIRHYVPYVENGVYSFLEVISNELCYPISGSYTGEVTY